MLPAGQQVRVAAPGRKLRESIPATVIVIYCPDQRGWAIYLDSDPSQAVVIPTAAARVIAEKVLQGP